MARQKKISKWLKYKFRITFTANETFEERKVFKFNRLGFLLLTIFSILTIIAITYVAIAYTPIRELIPGYPDKETKKGIVENTIRLDSLEHEIQLRDQYLANMKQVLLGEIPGDTQQTEIPIYDNNTIDSSTTISNFNLSDIVNTQTRPVLERDNSEKIAWTKTFFPPVQGMITNKFNPAQGHFGTDLVTSKNESVFASLDGTIILANWTIETGYTVQIQHKGNYLTVYRHLKKLNKTTGDKVKAGDIIGYYGNTGEVSFGDHLHFEIWHNGTPIDPEKLINF